MLASIGAAFTVFAAGFSAWLVVRWVGVATTVDDLTAPERFPFLGGGEPGPHAWNRFHARYYVMALLFLAFDMEMVFMYPWAVVFAREGMIALVEMGMFISILLIGVLYAWREHALEWA